MKLLVTGFGPFPGVPINPTELIVRGLGQNGPAVPWEKIVCQVLPVEYEADDDAIVRLLNDHSPDVLLLLGVKSAGTGLSLERFALNVDDCAVPDAAGVVRVGQPIREGGPHAYPPGFDLVALRDAMAAQNYPVDISNHAGAYLCNHVYYRALDFAAASRPATRVLFVHVPMPASAPGRDFFETGSLGYLEELVRELIRLLHNCP